MSNKNSFPLPPLSLRGNHPLSLRGGYNPPSQPAARRLRLADTPHGQEQQGARAEPDLGDLDSPHGQSATRNLDDDNGYDDADADGNEHIDALLQVAQEGADQQGAPPAAAAQEGVQEGAEDQGAPPAAQEAPANANNQEVVAFVGPAPEPESAHIQMFSISYHGNNNTDKGVSFKIKSWGGILVFVVHSIREGGQFEGTLQVNDVIFSVNNKPVIGTIRKNVPVQSQEQLFMLTIERAKDLIFVCQRNGTGSHVDLADAVTADVASNPTQSPTDQIMSVDYPIGLPVRVRENNSDIEGVVIRTLRNGTVWVQPDDMTVAHNIIVEQQSHDNITNILRERMDARQAAHDAEINAQNRAEGRRNNPRSNRPIANARIQAAAEGLMPHRFEKEFRCLKRDEDRMEPLEKPLAFHDPPHLADNKFTELKKLPESGFSIPSALSFTRGGFDPSLLPQMTNAGDQVESNDDFVDMNWVQNNQGFHERVHGRTKQSAHGNTYYFKHDHPQDNEDAECNIGTCIRTGCSGRIERIKPSMDDYFQDVSGFHRITRSHSNDCQVISLVENKAILDLSDNHMETLLTWRIRVKVGWISHPIHVSPRSPADISSSTAYLSFKGDEIWRPLTSVSKTVHNLDQIKEMEDALQDCNFVRVIELFEDKNEGLQLIRCTYFISSFGRVLSYHRGRFRFIGFIKHQYEHVQLTLIDEDGNKIRRTYPVASLVLREFTGGPVYGGGNSVNHINFRRRDNIIFNLLYTMFRWNCGNHMKYRELDRSQEVRATAICNAWCLSGSSASTAGHTTIVKGHMSIISTLQCNRSKVTNNIIISSCHNQWGCPNQS